MLNNAFTKLSQLSKIKQRELVLPLAKEEVFVTPLLVGDDIQIRTSIMSPDNYDNEICSMIFKHTKFINREPAPTYQNFINELTLVDKQILLWGILNSTYKTINDEAITCSNDKCKEKTTITIPYDDLFQEDSITLWEEELPPNQFIKTSIIDIGDEIIDKIEVDLSITPLSYRIATLRLITTEKIKENFELIGSVFTLPEQLTSITKEIRVIGGDGTVSKLNNIQEIHMAYNKYISHDIIEIIKTDYEIFDKYIPKFYINFICPKCNTSTKYSIDPEVYLFRNYFRWAQSK